MKSGTYVKKVSGDVRRLLSGKCQETFGDSLTAKDKGSIEGRSRWGPTMPLAMAYGINQEKGPRKDHIPEPLIGSAVLGTANLA